MAASARVPEDKRAAIVAAALVLFGRYGYRRTSVDDVAREAGIAKGTVYLYFENKEAIFRALCRAVIDRVLADAERASAARAPVAERLRGIVEAKFGYFHDLVHRSPHASELIDSKHRLSADLFRQADRAYLRIVTRAIAAAIARGELAPRRLGLGAEAAAELLVASAHGATASLSGPRSARVLRRRLDDLVRVLVAGFGGVLRA